MQIPVNPAEPLSLHIYRHTSQLSNHVVNALVTFSMARLGGVPIPRKVMGVLFWFIFVSVQVSQWLTMALTIFMEIMQ